MDTFSLQHTVLYAKHWYKRFNPSGVRKTLWDDLAITLEMDGYLGTFEGDSEIARKQRITHLLVGQFSRLPNKGHANSLQAFFDGIRPYNCWKYGYYTKDFTFMRCQEDIDESPVYDYDEAVARYCLSHFNGLDNSEWKVTKPDYTKLPRRNGVTEKILHRHFGHLLSVPQAEMLVTLPEGHNIAIVQYVGDKAGFDKLILDFVPKFNAKLKEGHFKDVILYIRRVMNGIDVFQFILAKQLPNETILAIAERLGLSKIELNLEKSK